jgi:hypothetical protein
MGVASTTKAIHSATTGLRTAACAVNKSIARVIRERVVARMVTRMAALVNN